MTGATCDASVGAPAFREPALVSSGVMLWASTDGGRTWGNPATRAAEAPNFIEGMGNCVVLSDGTGVLLTGILNDLKTSDGREDSMESNGTLDGVTCSQRGEPQSQA